MLAVEVAGILFSYPRQLWYPPDGVVLFLFYRFKCISFHFCAELSGGGNRGSNKQLPGGVLLWFSRNEALGVNSISRYSPVRFFEIR